jgi:polyadenylate-binding protein
MLAGNTPSPSATYTSSSLYVGDLAPDVSEGKLFDIFNSVGPVASIRVCRDAMLKRSLGYAYVNFHNQADAERAQETMNYTMISGRPCRIMWSQRDPSLRKSGVGNIFVKSLNLNVHHKELQETFSLFGNILSCKVALDAEGKSKGYGYVHFETDEAAKAAVERMDEIEIMGTKVEIQTFQKKTAPQRAANWTNLFVKNVPTHLSESDLSAMFAEFGKVQSLKLMVYSEEEVAKEAAGGKGRGLVAGSSKGFGFVSFEEHEHAAAAVEALNGKLLADPDSVLRRDAAKAKAQEHKADAVAAAVAAAKAAGGDEAVAATEAGAKADAAAAAKAAAATEKGESPMRELYVSRAQKKDERSRELKKKFQLLRDKTMQSYMGVNLYVKNLDDQLDDASLDAAFKAYGTITSSRIMRNPDGSSKGFGFVCFSSPEEATAASNDMIGKLLGGKPIFVALAQRRDQRHEMLSQSLLRGPAGPMPAGGGGPRGPMPGHMYGAVPMMYQTMGGRGGQQGGPYGMPMMPGGKGMGRGPGGPMPYAQRGAGGPGYPMQGGYPGGMPGQMMPGGQQQQQPRQRNGRQGREGQGGRGAQGAGKGGQQMRQAAPPGQGQVRRTSTVLPPPLAFSRFISTSKTRCFEREFCHDRRTYTQYAVTADTPTGLRRSVWP